MRRLRSSIWLIIVILPVLLFSGRSEKAIPERTKPADRNGVAIIMTGAAARIPQEAALLEELDRRGMLRNVVFISGVSSGALNSVALNGILSKKMTWTWYRDLLYGLKNDDVYIQTGKKLPVNTDPARALFKKVAEEKLGYKTIGDLPYMTEISVTRLKGLEIKKEIFRLCSRKINEESDTTLNLVDIMMASTSFPVAFPPVKIRNVTTIPDGEYIDGGVGEDHLPYHALLEFEEFRGAGVEKVYIISRKSDSLPVVSEELKTLGINDRGIFDRLGISLDAMMKKGFIKRLEAYAAEAPDLVERTYVWVPDFKQDFLMFNFDDLRKQYEVTSAWAKTHDPVPLGDYLLPYLVKKK